MALYDPNQSLPANLQMAGFTNEPGTFGAERFNPNFLSAIQTALARAGYQGYGQQTAFDLIASADPNRTWSDPLGYANSLLGQSGVQGFSNVQDLHSANAALPGHTGGTGIGDMFDHIADTGSELIDNPGIQALLAAGTGGAALGGAFGGGVGLGTGVPAGLSEEAAMLGLGDLSTGLGSTIGAAEGAGIASGITEAGLGGSSILGTLGLGGAAAGLGSLVPGIGDILKGIGGVLPSANTAAALAPILAAIGYAQNQGPFDTSRLTSTYDQFEPDALAYEYDQNTNAGRNALTSSLTNRGVMGSSFGNMDLTNFQTSRDLGRRSLVNQGIAARGGIANNILEAQVKERQLKNQLYGTSLLALGNVFGGRNQPTAGV